MTSYYEYLITSLDLHSIDLEDFKYGGTNITAFRLVDPHNPEVINVVRSWILGEKRFPSRVSSNPVPFIKVKVDNLILVVAVFKMSYNELKTDNFIFRLRQPSSMTQSKCLLQPSAVLMDLKRSVSSLFTVTPRPRGSTAAPWSTT